MRVVVFTVGENQDALESLLDTMLPTRDIEFLDIQLLLEQPTTDWVYDITRQFDLVVIPKQLKEHLGAHSDFVNKISRVSNIFWLSQPRLLYSSLWIAGSSGDSALDTIDQGAANASTRGSTGNAVNEGDTSATWQQESSESFNELLQSLDAEHRLTRLERSLLVLFGNNLERPLSRMKLMTDAWGLNVHDGLLRSRRVDVYVSRLRQILKTHAPPGWRIVSIREIGYKLTAPSRKSSPSGECG